MHVSIDLVSTVKTLSLADRGRLNGFPTYTLGPHWVEVHFRGFLNDEEMRRFKGGISLDITLKDGDPTLIKPELTETEAGYISYSLVSMASTGFLPQDVAGVIVEKMGGINGIVMPEVENGD